MNPLIKYRGGKRREIPNFQHLIPRDYDRYIEPFFGGGAVFFQQEPAHAIINDINKPLMTFYRQIANQYDIIIRELRELSTMYESNSEEYENIKRLYPNERIENKNEALYYRIRDMYNGLTESEYQPATLYYFINKTAYSGMIRFNTRGEYNVPFGRYKHFNVEIISPDHSRLLQNAEILNVDFEEVFNMTKGNDFVFLDPPYDCAFHDYGNIETDFGEDAHRRLAAAFYDLGCRALMVIGRTDLTTELYGKNVIAEYPIRYSVNIRNRFDTAATHIVVSNF